MQPTQCAQQPVTDVGELATRSTSTSCGLIQHEDGANGPFQLDLAVGLHIRRHSTGFGPSAKDVEEYR